MQRAPKGCWGGVQTFLGLVLAGGAGVFGPPLHAAPADGRLRVMGVPAVRTNLVRRTRETGEVRPYREVHLHPRVAGFVRTVEVNLGDRVREGQVLATLEVPELDSDLARSRALERRAVEEVGRAEAQLEEARLAHHRLSAVAAQGGNLIPAQELDAARVRQRVAEANTAAAREQVAVAQAEVARLETIRGYTRITAPFDGLVSRLGAVAGQWVTPGGTGAGPGLFRISEVARLRLVFPIASSEVPQVPVGTPVEARVDGVDGMLPGRVSRRAGQIESSTRTMDVEVDLENPGWQITAGAYATVEITLEARTNVLAIPLQALIRGAEPRVWRVGTDQRLEERKVRLGLEVPTHVEILEGLADGDRVVVGRLAGLQAGQEVKLAEGGRRP